MQMDRYSKIFPVRSPSGKKSQVKFSITTSVISNVSQSKDIVMQLTKDENPLFFFTHRMTENDFRQFKLQQDLKLDFASFPQMLIELLESVLQEESKFYLWFDDNDATDNDIGSSGRRNAAVFKIVQSAGHKDLTHLTFKFSPADAKQIQVYLSDTILHLKRRVSVLEKQIRQTETDEKRQCQALEDVLRTKTEELDVLRAALAKTTETSEKEKQELLSKLEQERLEWEAKWMSLQEETLTLREQLQSTNGNADSAREEFQHLHEEALQMQEQLENCKREIIEMEKLRNELQTRLESAEDDAEAKDDELEQLKDRYQALLDQKRKLEHSLHDWMGRGKKFEELYQVQCHETEKAVQIMHKCVNYSHTCKDKASKAEMAARKLQELLKNKEDEVAKLNAEKERLVKETAELKETNSSLTSSVNDLQRRLKEVSMEKEQGAIQAGGSRFTPLHTSATGQPQQPKDYPPLSQLLGEFRLNATSKTPILSGSIVTTGGETNIPFLHPKHLTNRN